MKINIQKEPEFRKPLPAPPFVIRLSSKDDWYKLLDAYPELEENYIWLSNDKLMEFEYDSLYRYFYEEGHVTKADENVQPDWPLMEYS